MADILLEEQSSPGTPSAGQGIIFIDTSASVLIHKDDSGGHHGGLCRAAIAAQGPGFAADTYITNSGLILPSFSMQAGMVFLWNISASKTGASTATPIYQVRIGAAQTTGDTSVLTLTGPAQTAIADIGTFRIMLTCRSVGVTGVIQGTAWWTHTGTAASTTVQGTGFANNGTGHIEGTSGGFNNTALGGQFIGLSINGGAASVWTLTQSVGEWRV